MSSSIFDHIETAPPDPILNTALAFKADTDANKVNLGIGAYRTEEGKPWVLPVVEKVEEMMLAEIKAGRRVSIGLPVEKGLASGEGGGDDAGGDKAGRRARTLGPASGEGGGDDAGGDQGG